MKHIQWRRYNEKLSLFIINDKYPEGIIYNACKTPGLFVSDYIVSGGSKGYATSQNCLKLGYTYLSTPQENV